jgi:hypothetical protein
MKIGKKSKQNSQYFRRIGRQREMKIGKICAGSLRSPVKQSNRIRKVCNEPAIRNRWRSATFALARSAHQPKEQQNLPDLRQLGKQKEMPVNRYCQRTVTCFRTAAGLRR